MRHGILFIALILTLAAARAACAAPIPRLLIDSVVVEGQPDDADVPDDITRAIPNIYDADAVKRAVRALAHAMAASGYPYAKISASVAAREPPDSHSVSPKVPVPDTSDAAAIAPADGDTVTITAALRILIEPDERVCNAAPVIMGVDRRQAMYRRDVTLVSGQRYSAADVNETLRRFSVRPYIRSAAAGTPVIIEDAPPCDDGTRAAATPFTIVENRGMEIAGVLGYASGRGGESGALSGQLDLSLLNMLRYGENFAASYAGTPVLQRLGLSVAWPWIFDLPLEAGAEAGFEIEDDAYGFMSARIWGAAEIGARWKYGAALRGSETVPHRDTAAAPYRFYGVDIFISLMRPPWERGKRVWEFSAKTGSGTADREKLYARSSMELAAGVHYPVGVNYAAAARASAASLFTDEAYLPPSEQYRIGGHGSLRGYAEDEFAFRSALYSQFEALYYFNRSGAVFIFVDGGVGFGSSGRLTLSESTKLFGYGVGLRFPSRVGAVSVEWARNAGDWPGGLGRVHVGVRHYGH